MNIGLVSSRLILLLLVGLLGLMFLMGAVLIVKLVMPEMERRHPAPAETVERAEPAAPQ